MAFFPEEIIFSASTQCNLFCPHCNVKRTSQKLPINLAIKFLRDCKKHNIDKIGFSGGEPFLRPKFLLALIKEAIRLNIVFDRIMTNGVWFKDEKKLNQILNELFTLGYDGKFCISFDALHQQDFKKIVIFIKEAKCLYKTKDIISLAYIVGIKDKETKNKLKVLAKLLQAKLNIAKGYIKNQELFIKLHKINFSAIGETKIFKNHWDGRWFKEDYCQGPGNVFFVLPNAEVKPCCGYATEEKHLTIGNIKKDSAATILERAKKNKLIQAIFTLGLDTIGKRLSAIGVKFPGKSSNHCYFCYYLLTEVPRDKLEQVL